MWAAWCAVAGAQTLEEHVVFEVEVPDPTAIEVADLDLDGDVDLIVAGPTTAAWFDNDGTGQFTARRLPVTGTTINVFDVDGDGALDLQLDDQLLLNATGFQDPTDENGDDPRGYHRRYVISQEGALGWVFTRFNSLVHIELDGELTTQWMPGEVTFVDWGDVDLDGEEDVLVGGSGFMRWIPVRGGSPALPVAIHNPTGQLSSVRRMALVAMPDDDRPDLVVSFDNDALLWIRGTRAGFGEARVAAVHRGPRFAVGDLDGDGWDDVALGGTAWIRTTAGTPEVRWSTSPHGDGPVAVGDIDGDGDADLIVASAALAMHRGFGEGTFEPGVQIDGAWCGLGAAIPADVNQDGATDVLFSTTCSGALWWMSWQEGGFTDPEPLWLGVASAHDLAYADLSLDGIPDAAFANAEGGVVWIQRTSDGTSPTGATLLDPAGGPDLMAVTTVNGERSLVGVGPGRVWERRIGVPRTWPVSINDRPLDVHDLLVVDLEGDEHIDIIVPTNPPQVITWSGQGFDAPRPYGRGTSLGPFTTGIVALEPVSPVRVAAARPAGIWEVPPGAAPVLLHDATDAPLAEGRGLVAAVLGPDRQRDLVAPLDAGGVLVLPRSRGKKGPRTFGTQRVQRLTAADLDHDGDLDLLGLAPHARLVWYENTTIVDPEPVTLLRPAAAPDPEAATCGCDTSGLAPWTWLPLFGLLGARSRR